MSQFGPTTYNSDDHFMLLKGLEAKKEETKKIKPEHKRKLSNAERKVHSRIISEIENREHT